MNHRRCASARSRHQQILDSNFEAHGGYGAALKANGTAFVSRTTLFADPTVAGANLVALETTGKVTVHDIAFEVNPPVAGDWTSIQVIRNRGGSVHVERSSFCSVAGTNPPISVLKRVRVDPHRKLEGEGRLQQRWTAAVLRELQRGYPRPRNLPLRRYAEASAPNPRYGVAPTLPLAPET